MVFVKSGFWLIKSGGNMDDNKSFIKLHRRMLKWEWYDDINTKVLFIHLLLIANWEDKKWKGIVIKRGQVVVGRKKLSEETGLTEQQIRTSLNKLISTNEITSKTTNKYTLLTIEKYDIYQQKEEKNNTQNNQQLNQQITNNQPTNNQQITTTKEYKENKEYKEIKNNNSVGVSSLFSYVEENFGRTLAPLEYEEINTWKDNKVTKYAIKQAVLNGKYNIKYIASILSAYERENIVTVQQAQEREREYETMRKKKQKGETPNWFDKPITKEVSKEAQKEMEELLKQF